MTTGVVGMTIARGMTSGVRGMTDARGMTIQVRGMTTGVPGNSRSRLTLRNWRARSCIAMMRSNRFPAYFERMKSWNADSYTRSGKRPGSRYSA